MPYDQKYVLDFYQKCIDMSKHANIKAQIYRAISIFSSTTILMLSISIVVLSRFDEIQDYSTVIASIITGTQIFISVYTPEKKAILIKKISQKFQQLSRELRKVDASDSEKIDNLFNQVEELDLTMFNMNFDVKSKSEDV